MIRARTPFCCGPTRDDRLRSAPSEAWSFNRARTSTSEVPSAPAGFAPAYSVPFGAMGRCTGTSTTCVPPRLSMQCGTRTMQTVANVPGPASSDPFPARRCRARASGRRTATARPTSHGVRRGRPGRRFGHVSASGGPPTLRCLLLIRRRWPNRGAPGLIGAPYSRAPATTPIDGRSNRWEGGDGSARRAFSR